MSAELEAQFARYQARFLSCNIRDELAATTSLAALYGLDAEPPDNFEYGLLPFAQLDRKIGDRN